jgi:hypothetical protein
MNLKKIFISKTNSIITLKEINNEAKLLCFLYRLGKLLVSNTAKIKPSFTENTWRN